ncbi:hypothetical protein G6F50_016487 [Rhizopus delemar]|uniref:Fumarylacetoacetase-like C-terminal domain-containing protein n=1 Tax=Rhizopus delemar TaxID=936053 RepID=A0A9P6XT68_9FUNG|nr:hypothetical protein G6F50_016487 [Rhizopus delemar]
MVFIGVFVGAAMILVGLAWKLLAARKPGTARPVDPTVVEGEYRVVRKPTAGTPFLDARMSDVSDVIPAVALPRVPVVGGGSFPVHRIYCVGRNFADHAREMGAALPAAASATTDPPPF